MIPIYNKSNEFATPQKLFDTLNDFWGPFTLDVSATSENAKCEKFFTKEENGLDQEWTGNVWCNPPYSGPGKGSEVGKWVEKAYQEVWHNPACDAVTMLLPAKLDQKWFHNLFLKYGGDIIYIQGRVKFEGPWKYAATFPSIVIRVPTESVSSIYSMQNYQLSLTFEQW